MKRNKFIYLPLVSLISACSAFDYHPYSVGIDGPVDLNTSYMEKIERMHLEPPYRFAFITDTQGSLDETTSALEIIKKRGDIDFIVHGGDQTDFGLPKEFVWCRDMMEKSGLPYVTVIGNHDCLGNGNDTFDHIYGPQNFSFNAGDTHFLCLNTVALEYDYSNPVPDLTFIENDCMAINRLNEQHPDSIRRTIVVMHSRPYDEQFNNNVARPFNYYISGFPGMSSDNSSKPLMGFCINGHNHSFSITDIFENGILYYQCPNMGKRTFFIFTIYEDGHELETVTF